MAKGSLGPILENGLRELARRGRSDTALDKQAFTASTASSSSTHSSGAIRISYLPIVKLPSFRRAGGWKRAPSHSKTPLMAMKLSSQSFIDSVVQDDHSKNTLYTMKTEGATTRITRSISATSQFCTIRWPKTLPTVVKGKMASDGVSIHIGDARWIGGENFLKRGPRPDSSRKFSLRNYSQILKWKRYGNVYWCTTASVKGPVAILELAKDKTPTKLTIFETLHDKYDTRGVLSYQGVYIPLIDYLLVSALLLVTDLQEWMLVKKCEGRNIIVPNPLGKDGEKGEEVETTTTDVQWRKILYREPLFPKLLTETSSNITGYSDTDSAISPLTPSSPRYNHVYGQRPITPAGQSILSFSSSEYEGDNEQGTIRPLSPSMESAFYPSSVDGAPAHGYADPTYRRNSVPPDPLPPVPPLPLEYQRSNQLLPSPTSVSSPASPSRPPRRLPQPPTLRGHLAFAPTSTQPPPNPTPSTTTDSRAQASTNPARPPIHNRARSMTARAAPRPLPNVPSSSVGNNLRRSRSHNLLAQEFGSEVSSFSSHHAPAPPFSPRSQRSLPPTPSLDPGSPPPDVVQEELRAAAAAARAIRSQNQRLDFLPPIPDTPSSAKSEEDDLAQWVQILTSPTGRTLPNAPLSRPVFDMPPPAYNSLSFSQNRERA